VTRYHVYYNGPVSSDVLYGPYHTQEGAERIAWQWSKIYPTETYDIVPDDNRQTSVARYQNGIKVF